MLYPAEHLNKLMIRFCHAEFISASTQSWILKQVQDDKSKNDLTKNERTSLMSILRYLLFFIALSINVHAAIAQEPNNSFIETEIQGDEANKDFITLTTTFIHQELLNEEQKINLYRITKAWQQTYESFKDECLHNNPRCQHHALILTMYTDILKQALLKIQILSIKQQIPRNTMLVYKEAKTLVYRALTDRETSLILLNILTMLHTWYKEQWQQDTISSLVTNQDITTTVYNAIPTDMRRSYWLRNLILGNGVYEPLTVNLFEDLPAFARDYIACIIMYHSLIHAANAETFAALEQSKEALWNTLSQLKETASLNSAQKLVLTLLDRKLFQIDIPFVKQLALLAKKNTTLLALFKRHTCLIQADAFEVFKNSRPAADKAVIESYVSLTHQFFYSEQPLSESFAYELENVACYLQHLPENYDKGFIKRGWKGTTLDEQIIGEMCNIITDILANCSTAQAVPSSSNSLISYITSGQWLKNGSLKQVSQQSNGSIILDFASQLIGQKQFSNFKTAALYALIYASPFLLVKLIKFAWPWLSNDLKTQLSGFVGTDAAKNQDSLMTFVSQNPDVIKQVCDKHPEIVDSIAQVLKQQVGG